MFGHAGIAGGRVDFRDLGTLGQLPDHSMLTRSRTNNHYPHVVNSPPYFLEHFDGPLFRTGSLRLRIKELWSSRSGGRPTGSTTILSWGRGWAVLEKPCILD